MTRARCRLMSRTEATRHAGAEQRHGANEMALFPMGMHHVIDESSEVNRLRVLMIPGLLGEVPSDKL